MAQPILPLPLAASPSLPVLADTPNQPSVAPTRRLAASARRSIPYRLKLSASLDCCSRFSCRPTNGAPLFSHRGMRHFSPDLVCHVRRALFARYDHHGSTHRRPRIDRQVRPAWVPARNAKQVIASNFTVDAHGRCQSSIRFDSATTGKLPHLGPRCRQAGMAHTCQKATLAATPQPPHDDLATLYIASNTRRRDSPDRPQYLPSSFV